MKYGWLFIFGLFFIACKKADNPAPVRGEFSASWVENDSLRTITAKSSLFKINYRMAVLYSTPSVGSSRNLTLYMADTLAGSYEIGPSGTPGKASALLNGVNGPDGNIFFNSTSGTLKITEKYPTWISGEFEILGNATGGPLEKVKGNFKYLPIR